MEIITGFEELFIILKMITNEIKVQILCIIYKGEVSFRIKHMILVLLL
jgi:hypothetical protein